MQPIRHAAHHSTSSSTGHEANKQKRRNYRLALPQPNGVQRSNPPTTVMPPQSTHRSQPVRKWIELTTIQKKSLFNILEISQYESDFQWISFISHS